MQENGLVKSSLLVKSPKDTCIDILTGDLFYNCDVPNSKHEAKIIKDLTLNDLLKYMSTSKKVRELTYRGLKYLFFGKDEYECEDDPLYFVYLLEFTNIDRSTCRRIISRVLEMDLGVDAFKYVMKHYHNRFDDRIDRLLVDMVIPNYQYAHVLQDYEYSTLNDQHDIYVLSYEYGYNFVYILANCSRIIQSHPQESLKHIKNKTKILKLFTNKFFQNRFELYRLVLLGSCKPFKYPVYQYVSKWFD